MHKINECARLLFLSTEPQRDTLHNIDDVAPKAIESYYRFFVLNINYKQVYTYYVPHQITFNINTYPLFKPPQFSCIKC